MKKRICTHCGYIIMKSGLDDPYICRDCESFLVGWSRMDDKYARLDM